LTYLTQKDIFWKFDFFYCDTFNFLKKTSTFASILIYWIPDTSDYALVIILSIVNEENKVHPVIFHFYTFTIVELNYDIHDKELITIFEAFKIW